MSTEYDIELQANLKDKIDNGIIIIHADTDKFFNEIERLYPVSIGRIDWSKKKPIYFAEADEKEPGYKREKVNDFLKKIILNFPALSTENIVVLGDRLTELGFEMKFIDFIDINEHFFQIPQHTYVWFTVKKLCANLSFEDELYFG